MDTEKEQLQDQYLDTLIRMAFDLEEAEQLRKKMTDIEYETVAQEHVQAAWTKAMHKITEQEQCQRKERRKRLLERMVRGTVRAAACLALVCVLVTSVMVASSASFRAQLMHIITDVDQKNEEIRIYFVKEKPENAVVPEGWIGEYYPTVVPDGMKLARIGEVSSFVEYESENDSCIRWGFAEMDEHTVMTMSSKGATVYEGEINDFQACIFEGYTETDAIKWIKIIWFNDDKCFLVYGSGMEREEVQKIAESVKKI